MDIPKNRDIYVPPRQDIPAMSPDIYEAMGKDNIFRMLEDFYQELGRSEISFMFTKDLVEASRRSAAFYVQLFGGPGLYNEQYGNPMMRRRHMPFIIDEERRVVWASCFYKVLEHAVERYNFPEEHLESFKKFIEGFSKWMVNKSNENKKV
jgi:hemoglobin